MLDKTIYCRGVFSILGYNELIQPSKYRMNKKKELKQINHLDDTYALFILKLFHSIKSASLIIKQIERKNIIEL